MCAVTGHWLAIHDHGVVKERVLHCSRGGSAPGIRLGPYVVVDLVIDDMLRTSAAMRTLVHDEKLQMVGGVL